MSAFDPKRTIGSLNLPSQEQIDLFEKALRCRILFQQNVIIALECDELCARDSRCQLASKLEWNLHVVPCMHHQGWDTYFWQELDDVKLACSFEIACRAFRRGRFSLQVVKAINLLFRRARHQMVREQLTNTWIIRAPL